MEAERTNPSDWLLAAMIVALPLMKPAVHEPIIAADLLFLALTACFAIEAAVRRRRLFWARGFGALLAYLAALAPSLLASSNLPPSLLKYATEFYLVGLAGITAAIVDSEARLRRVVLAWLAGTAVTCIAGVLGLLAFASGWMPTLLEYSSFGFGSLPPGDYPRMSLTFFNANMACNYLTGSLALLLIAGKARYLGRAAWWSLLAGIAIESLSTLSAGLGGIALLAGAWIWLVRKHSAVVRWAAMLAGAGIAVLFVVALSLTIVPYPAPFTIHLPRGITLYASGRVMIWTAAAEQFARHPLLGVGIGTPPVDVHYSNPSGYVEDLTDAHNVFLSIAAQAGMIGLIGLAAIIGFVAQHTRGRLRTIVLGLTVLDMLVYQGLGGSFEDTRHIWVLLGLFMAACRLDLIRADGSNRKADAPSHC